MLTRNDETDRDDGGRARFDLVTIDVLEPRVEAQFWCALLGLDVCDDEDDGRWVMLGHAAGSRVLGLQRSTPQEIAARSGDRIRLDLTCAAARVGAERRRIESLGAERSATTGEFRSPCGIALNLAAIDRADGLRLAGVTIAADEPIASEEFWRGALTSSERVRTGPSAPGGPRSRVHLDLACDPARFDAETQQFIALGAVRIGPSRWEPYGRNQIFLDPEGLPFCLNAYNER